MRIRPKINAKGMGLFLSSYCDLFLVKGNKDYLEKALKCAEWLKQNRSENYQGWSWGYPFDWQSPILIPKGTPSSIASVTVGDGFYSLYKCTGDKQYLTICKQICDFFLNDLKITYNENGAICSNGWRRQHIAIRETKIRRIRDKFPFLGAVVSVQGVNLVIL